MRRTYDNEGNVLYPHSWNHADFDLVEEMWFIPVSAGERLRDIREVRSSRRGLTVWQWLAVVVLGMIAIIVCLAGDLE